MEIKNRNLARLLKTQMVQIPKGKITLRDDRIKQSWEVNINAFSMAKFPVTQDLYFEVMKASPSLFKGDKKPVESVSWEEAIQFCNLLSAEFGLQLCYTFDNDTVLADATANGYRLPTEAEWQYACQAGTTAIRYGELDGIAWYKENSNGET